MANILVVLPYSGAQFGGGLAVLNQKLIFALDKLAHKVKLVTMDLPVKLMPVQEEHGACQIIYILNDQTKGMVDAGGPKGEKDRDKLYELINDPEIILHGSVIGMIKGDDDFYPDIIIGHSRFSGPAAIQLKQVFPKATTQYFLHSFPVEGSALVGYAAYEMDIDAELAERKFAKEKSWMPKADLVVGMGPLIRAGAMLILEEAKAVGSRVHEALPGIELTDEQPVEYGESGSKRKVFNLLLCGRASAPIKGLEDLLLAVREARDDGCPVHVDVLWWEDMNYINRTPRLINTEQWVLPSNVNTDMRFSPRGINSTTRNVNLEAAQTWINEMMGVPRGEQWVTLRGKASGSGAVNAAYRTHDAVLMPSYIEHFGLVPFEALGHGVPVLVNQVSGSGMFLGDRTRFPRVGPPCVVNDFKGSMDDPREFLVDVARDAFDGRPRAWGKAIQYLCAELEMRFDMARTLRRMLSVYTYDHFAIGIVAAADKKYDKCRFTYQGPEGQVMVP